MSNLMDPNAIGMDLNENQIDSMMDSWNRPGKCK
jgi:hypothetical protein